MIQRIAGLVVGALSATLILAPAAWAQSPTPYVDIHSAGPLSDIYIGNDLGCQVREGGFSSTEFFPERRRSGRLRDVLEYELVTAIPDGVVWDRTSRNHQAARTPSFTNGEIPFTPVSQTFTGSGTASNPYQVTTIVKASIQQIRGLARRCLQFTEVDSVRRRRRFLPDGHHRLEHGAVTMDARVQLYHVARLPVARLGQWVRRRSAVELPEHGRLHDDRGQLAPARAVRPDHDRGATGSKRHRRRSGSDLAHVQNTSVRPAASADSRQRHGDRVASPGSRHRCSLQTFSYEHHDRATRSLPAASRSSAPPALRSAASSPRSATRTRAPPRARTRPRSTGVTARRRPGPSPAETAASRFPATIPTRRPARTRSRSRSPRSAPTWGPRP